MLIVWILAHAGIHGNEMTDREAEKGRTNKNKIHVVSNKDDNKSAIKEKDNQRMCTKMRIKSLKGRHAYKLVNASRNKCT